MTKTTPTQPEATFFIAKKPQQTTKTYKRRWWILTIYVLYTAANAFQWMEYAIISNIVAKYYNVSTIAVDWTSIMFMSCYAIIFVPVSYIIEKKVNIYHLHFSFN